MKAVYLFCAMLLCVSNANAEFRARKVASTGDAALIPGIDATFNVFLFSAPLNNSGEVGFGAPVQVDINGVPTTVTGATWLGNGNELRLATVPRLAATEVSPVAQFTGAGFPSLLADGRFASASGLVLGAGGVTETNNNIIVAWDELVPKIIAREGTQAPGVPLGANFRGFLGRPVALSNGGAAFYAWMPTGSAGVNSLTDRGYWATGSSGLDLLVREGDPAPGASTFNFTNLKTPRFNSLGEIAFLADAGNFSLGKFTTGIWAGQLGNIRLMAAEGFQAPDLASGVVFSHVMKDPAIGSGGHVAFIATTDHGTGTSPRFHSAVWVGLPGEATQRYARGDLAPGVPVRGFLNNFNEVSVNRNGAVAFSASLELQSPALGNITHDNNDAIWSEWDNELRLVAREGNAAPGAGGAIFSTFGRPVINAGGQVAFEAMLLRGVDGVDASNDVGIWSLDPLGELQLIAREGGMLNNSNGDTRTIGQLEFEPWGGNGDTDRQLNDLGQLSFFAFFRDSTRGLFISDRVAIPEPSTIACALIAAMTVTLARRKT